MSAVFLCIGQVAAEGCMFKSKKLIMVWEKSVLSELNRGTERENTDLAVKQLVHTDLKITTTGENVPNRNRPGHTIEPGPGNSEEAEEINEEFSVDLQNQDFAVTAEVSSSILICSKSQDRLTHFINCYC